MRVELRRENVKTKEGTLECLDELTGFQVIPDFVHERTIHPGLPG